LVLSDCNNVNNEIQSLLKNWGADAFITELNVNYSHYAYFAVSALGLHNNPKADRTIDRPRPHRIEDPLLWIMKENGVFNRKGFYRPPRKKPPVKALIASLVLGSILGIAAFFFINTAFTTTGSLMVDVQENGMIYLNDKLIGPASPDAPKIIDKIESGEHWIRIEYKKYIEEKHIVIEKNRESNLSFSFRDSFENTIGMNLTYIPAGSCTMGSSIAESGRENDETQHDVSVDSFYMGQAEVTQDEYTEVIGSNPSYFKGSNRPVERVTWYEAVNFCNALSDMEGLERAYAVNGTQVAWNRIANGYRLPTETEWEFACRAGTTTAFNTGNTISTNLANYNGSATANVRSFLPNAWGIYDMHGNIREWCFDIYENYRAVAGPGLPPGYYIIPVKGQRHYPPSPSSQPAPAPPPPSPPRPRRVVRGGSWNEPSRNLRSAFRGAREPEGKYNTVGFRVVRTLEHE
jgi:formylglycine-generating enzyme required for sulfatase activity